jgi:hypothetical protein
MLHPSIVLMDVCLSYVHGLTVPQGSSFLPSISNTRTVQSRYEDRGTTRTRRASNGFLWLKRLLEGRLDQIHIVAFPLIALQQATLASQDHHLWQCSRPGYMCCLRVWVTSVSATTERQGMMSDRAIVPVDSAETQLKCVFLPFRWPVLHL